MPKPTLKMPTIKLSEKLTGIMKPKAQTVFNRPLDSERDYRISRVLHLTLLSIMIGLSMAVIGLKAMTLVFIEDNSDTGFTFQPSTNFTNRPNRPNSGSNDDDDNGRVLEPTILAALPRHLHTAPAKIALVAGVLAFCIGLAHAIFIIVDWKEGKRTQSYAFKRNTMFLHFSNSILVLFSLVSIFITHKSTSHFREGYIMRKASAPNNFPSDGSNPDTDGIRYNIGTFDLETWSCELKTVDGAKAVWSEYEKQCAVEMAGRMIVVPFVVAAFLISGACIAQMMRCRRDADGRRMKTEEVGVEMGKFEGL